MLSETDRRIALELRQRLAEFLDIIDFSVYGSRARGDADWASDLDVYIEVAAVTRNQRQQVDDVAWEIGFARDRIICPLVVTRDQREHGIFGASPIAKAIQHEGVPL